MAGVDTFDREAGRYEAWFLKHRNAYRAEVRALRQLTVRGGLTVEVGVGSGRFAAPLGVRFGIDPSRAMLRIARGRGIIGISGVGEILPFPRASFDQVLLVTTVCFLDDVKSALQEVGRVLRPGGRVIIGLVDRTSPLGTAYLRRKQESLFYRVATFYSVDEIVSLLGGVGFGEFRFRQTLFGPLSEVSQSEPVKRGFGEGSFVVVGADVNAA